MAAPSDAKKLTKLAISSVVPYRFNGILDLTSSFSGRPLLLIKPGNMLFILIFLEAYSSANNLVNAAKVDLNMTEVGNVGSGSNAAKVDMLIMYSRSLGLHNRGNQLSSMNHIHKICVHALIPLLIRNI